MNIQLLAALLLIGRVVAVCFNVLVINRQWKLRKLPTHPRLLQIRRVLSLLAILIFLGNLYPLFLDLYTLAHPDIRSTQTVNLVGVFYSLDNNLTFLFASILIWALYKIADVAIEVGELIAGNPPKKVEVKPKDQ